MGRDDEESSPDWIEQTTGLGERTLDHQVDAIREKSRTAIELIKINLFIASLLIALLRFGGVSPSPATQIWKASFAMIPFSYR